MPSFSRSSHKKIGKSTNFSWKNWNISRSVCTDNSFLIWTVSTIVLRLSKCEFSYFCSFASTCWPWSSSIPRKSTQQLVAVIFQLSFFPGMDFQDFLVQLVPSSWSCVVWMCSNRCLHLKKSLHVLQLGGTDCGLLFHPEKPESEAVRLCTVSYHVDVARNWNDLFWFTFRIGKYQNVLSIPMFSDKYILYFEVCFHLFCRCERDSSSKHYTCDAACIEYSEHYGHVGDCVDNEG